MNQGRKVFDGPLASIQEAQDWVRLRVNDFSAAVKVLRRAELIVNERDGEFIALAAEAKSEQVVLCLVQNEISVSEITPQQRDLEGFYLSLMRDNTCAASLDKPELRSDSFAPIA